MKRLTLEAYGHYYSTVSIDAFPFKLDHLEFLIDSRADLNLWNQLIKRGKFSSLFLTYDPIVAPNPFSCLSSRQCKTLKNVSLQSTGDYIDIMPAFRFLKNIREINLDFRSFIGFNLLFQLLPHFDTLTLYERILTTRNLEYLETQIIISSCTFPRPIKIFVVVDVVFGVDSVLRRSSLIATGLSKGLTIEIIDN